ncbi:MAG: hypothetical protein Q7T04_00410 [Dehalococcoidia bacterium]|nr:hypothetical protein [Dehalococcoidia bacterium]
MPRHKLGTGPRAGTRRAGTDAIIALLIVLALVVFLATLGLLVADDLARGWR